MKAKEIKSAGDIKILDLTPETITEYGVCGYKDMKKHPEIGRKAEWFRKYYPLGLRTKIIWSEAGGNQGMIEYIPGRYAHRPVKAEGYMFIHCLFVGFRKEYKGKGLACMLIDECIKEAREAGMKGVAAVTRKGSFMAKKDIFVKNGFVETDSEKPDFELMVLKFDSAAADPAFIKSSTEKSSKDITIYRSPQCPYSVKNVEAIMKTAESKNLKARLIEVDSAEAAQAVPCAFGTFCITYNGRVVSHHPISNTRFENILKAEKVCG